MCFLSAQLIMGRWGQVDQADGAQTVVTVFISMASGTELAREQFPNS